MMRNRLLSAVCLLVFVLGAGFARPGNAGGIPAGVDPDGMQTVIITLRDQADLQTISDGRTAIGSQDVIARLKSQTASQEPLLEKLANWQAEGKAAAVISFWIFNGLAVTADPGVIAELAQDPAVAAISPNLEFTAPAPPGEAAPNMPGEGAEPQPNIALIHAPEVWSLGHRGQGVVVASLDTGVSAAHPDLEPRWRGGANSWYDPNGEHLDGPVDVNGHGTAVMGIILGGEASGYAIGAAPEAQWIAVKIFDDSGKATTANIHLAYQWLLDPDGNPATPDAPQIVNNSWTYTSPGCNLEFQPDLQALRAAGISIVFSAGNFGPGGGTSASPANYPEAVAVGAVDLDGMISAESSRGPSACGEAETFFPEISAPGVEILSAGSSGGYWHSSGTSVAAPHVSGALALLLSAFPGLPVEMQASALASSAADLGEPGADNTYGVGLLDVRAAYDWVKENYVPPGYTAYLPFAAAPEAVFRIYMPVIFIP